jgi:transposase InsO family protein
VAESFLATLKEELVYRLVLPNREVARRVPLEFIEVFYNGGRLHSSLGYVTPAEYEAARRKSAEAA